MGMYWMPKYIYNRGVHVRKQNLTTAGEQKVNIVVRFY